MTSSQREPIWFNPPKFWEATKNMSDAETESLIDEVFGLAEDGNTEALRRFEFIGIGRSYLRQPFGERRTD